VRARVQPTRLTTWLLLVGAVAGALAYVGLRATLPSDGARIAFYGDAWSAAGIRIDPIDAPAAGLEGGDVVVEVAGHPMEAWLRDVIARAFTVPDASQPIDYALERDGAGVEAAVA
jgi:hypothetical protein